jgi:hypothetical protein
VPEDLSLICHSVSMCPVPVVHDRMVHAGDRCLVYGTPGNSFTPREPAYANCRVVFRASSYCTLVLNCCVYGV